MIAFFSAGSRKSDPETDQDYLESMNKAVELSQVRVKGCSLK